METPLTAREFLKRYHLPQLVRISSASGEQPDKEEIIGDELTSSCDNNEQVNNNNNKCSIRVVSPNQSNTSISSSFVVVGDSSANNVGKNNQRQYEKSDWTYCAASSMSTRGQVNTLSLIGGRSEQNLNFINTNNENASASRGLFRSFNQIEQQQDDDQFENNEYNDNHRGDYSEHRSFRSIPVWSSSTINNQHTTISSGSSRQPVEREQSSEHNNSRNQLARNSNNKKSVEFEQAYSVNGGSSNGNRSSSSSKWRNALQSVRLTPPSKRPALSKLQLNQPFLLYKAYKKLELCAYVIDLKNELNEKSGDPIYFPQNYPGWFSLSKSDNKDKLNRAQPLESIDDVCRTSAQIFLTRDEITAYQLPPKLSHLTKLKNNQLLALPLAINLDKAIKSNNVANESKLTSKEQISAANNNISDIRQIVIKCGQVLKICGVYEDVLPLIENGSNAGIVQGMNICKNGKQQQQQSHHKRLSYNPSPFHASYEQQQQAMGSNYQMAPHQRGVIPHHQMAAAAAMAVNNQRSSQSFYQIQVDNDFVRLNEAINSESSNSKRTQKLLKLRYSQNQSALAENGSYGQTNPFVYDHHQDFNYHEPLKQQAIKLRGRQHERPPQAIGQRYARCILLNQNSVDKLTNCTSASASSSSSNTDYLSKQQTSGNQQVHDDTDEVEVLIPINQKGRFYICATNQSIVTELYCYGCNSSTSSVQQQASSPPSLVFRLSQIVSLINLSRRLALKNRELKSRNNNNNNVDQLLIRDKLHYRQRIANKQQQQQHQHQRDLEDQQHQYVKLPLGVRLVIGPRPANFSPAMFGSSSTMESYFRYEENVGGHYIYCSYNRNYESTMNNNHNHNHNSQTKLHNQITLNNLSESICSCAQMLTSNSNSKCESLEASSEGYGIFSAALCIEKIVKRDVLLACTIKQDPLLHLDLFSNDEENSTQQPQSSLAISDKNKPTDNSWSGRSKSKSKSRNNSSNVIGGGFGDINFLSSSADRMNKSCKLVSLRESTDVKCCPLNIDNNSHQHQHQHQHSSSKLSDSKSIGKSSFSKLRVCRSLISLNSKRKKRPNIPPSMLMNTGCDRATLGGATSAHNTSKLLGLSSSSSNSLLKQDQQQQDFSSNNSIVLLEFDCDNDEILFTRTFVESSIPTSAIPDLVLKRMQFCHKNSLNWERQLKLSHCTLTQDYDLCQLEMRQSRRLQALRQHQLQQQHQQVSDHRLSLLNGNNSSSSNNNLLLNHQAEPLPQLPTTTTTTTGAITNSLSSGLAAFHVSDSVNSTGSSSSSSRSSSGVSSAAGNGVEKGHPNGTQTATATTTTTTTTMTTTNSTQSLAVAATSKQLQQNQNKQQKATTDSGADQANRSLLANNNTNNSSRLLRLVHRILPPFHKVASSSAGCGGAESNGSVVVVEVESEEAYERQRKIMCELNGRFSSHRGELVVDCGASCSSGSEASSSGEVSGSKGSGCSKFDKTSKSGIKNLNLNLTPLVGRKKNNINNNNKRRLLLKEGASPRNSLSAAADIDVAKKFEEVSTETSSSTSSSSSSPFQFQSQSSSSPCKVQVKDYATTATTLMNAQKVHKKLMRKASEGRHLVVASTRELLLDDDIDHHLRGGSVRIRSNIGAVSIDDEDAMFTRSTTGERRQLDSASPSASASEDSGSHLYESLERLNENRREQDEIKKQQQQQQQLQLVNQTTTTKPKATSRSSVLRHNNVENGRLKVGKSIDFLVSGSRMSALVSRQGLRKQEEQRADCFVGKGGKRRQDLRQQKSYDDDYDDRDDEQDDEDDDDDDDDWWQRSTRDSTGNVRRGGEEEEVEERHLNSHSHSQYRSSTQQALVSGSATAASISPSKRHSRSHSHSHSHSISQHSRNALLSNSSLSSSSGVQTNRTTWATFDAGCAMEPVGIEACNDDQFVSTVDDDDGEDCDYDYDYD